MKTPNRIFVIGHMGAGKALFGEALAKKLGWEYIDANPSLERYVGRSLTDIFGGDGVQSFHRCESEIIIEYSNKDNVVVVMEESVITTEENRKLLSSQYVIYLKVSIEQQIERMKSGRAPLLPIKDMSAFLKSQHRERNQYFEQVASLAIESAGVDADVNQVIKAFD